MMMWLNIRRCFVLLAVVIPPTSLAKTNWTYEFISISFNSSNEDIIKWDLRLIRLGRGNFAISGTVRILTEITEFEVRSYRSITGSSDYQLLPFGVPKQHFYDYINGIYKHTVMKSLKNCSDFPQFEDKFVPPMEMKTYVFNKCQILTDEFPQYLPAGYYKVIFIGGKEVKWNGMFLLKIEAKVF